MSRKVKEFYEKRGEFERGKRGRRYVKGGEQKAQNITENAEE